MSRAILAAAETVRIVAAAVAAAILAGSVVWHAANPIPCDADRCPNSVRVQP